MTIGTLCSAWRRSPLPRTAPKTPLRPGLPARARTWTALLACGTAIVSLCGSARATPAAPVPRQQQPQAVAPPIAVEPPLKDFGLVPPKTSLPTTFTLRNLGSTPVTIAAAMPSCKCTTVDSVVGQSIPAGGSLELPVTMEAPSTPGEKTAKVMLVFQGYGKPVVADLRCEVMLEIEVAEEYIDALKGVTSGKVTVRSRDGKPFRLLTSNGEAPDFIGFDPSTDEPRNSYDVRWSVAGWPCENMRLWWIFETDRPGGEIVPARIRHECTGSRADMGRFERKWIFKEQLVPAGAMAAGSTKNLVIEIENSEPKSGPNKPAQMNQGFRQVTGVRSTDPRAEAKLIRVTPKGTDETEIEIAFTIVQGAKGSLYIPVMVSTASGEFAVPVAVSVRE